MIPAETPRTPKIRPSKSPTTPRSVKRKQLKPWLIEVNASPSLSSDTPADYELKFGMLDDAFSIIDMEGRLNHQDHPEPQVGGFDLVWNNGPVAGNKTLPSMMGTHNDRLKNLRSLFAAGPR